MQRAPELKYELCSILHSFFVMLMLQEHWKQGSDLLGESHDKDEIHGCLALLSPTD